MGNSYASTVIDIGTGIGSAGGGGPRRPDPNGGNGSNRHACAWEQIKEALYLIADCMDNVGCSGDPVRQLADESQMQSFRGA